MTAANYDFTGKVAVVTGAGGGMGRECAIAFARAGASVVVADIAVGIGKETVELITSAGGSAVFAATDVSQEADVAALVDAAVATYGGLDHAVNAAAIEIETQLLADSETADFDRLMSVNVRSVYLCLKYEIRAMLARGGGSIVNIASTNSFRPRRKQSGYTTSKHAVLGITKASAIEYAPLGIRINAIAPGAIDTPMLRHAMESRGSSEASIVEQLSLIGRLGHVDEIANAALWLCSEQSSFTVGHTLAVDAGYLVR